MPQASVKISAAGLAKFKSIIIAGLAAGGGQENAIRRMFKRWAARYMTFTRRRFTTYSRGGGDWAPLAQSTVRARRGPAKLVVHKVNNLNGNAGANFAIKRSPPKATSRIVSILVDTAVLRNSLTIGNPGSLLMDIDEGIRVGIAPVQHNADSLTIGDIAGFHQYGEGRLPKREILVDPDDQTINGMAIDAQSAAQDIEKEVNDAQGK